MEFTYTQKREAHSYAQRSVTMGPRGMVASSQHLATQSGYRALSKGGNAVDAAVAMVATLNVVEPQSVGIGGDAFALIHLADKDRLIGMNASGRSPHNATLDDYHKNGFQEVPERGIFSITVPGALHGWAQAVERYGKLPFSDALEDAIFYAENGFPVSEVIAGDWESARELLLSRNDSAKAYLINGKAPRPGQVFQNRDLAKTMKKIAADGVDTFYQGEIRDAMVDFLIQHNGLFSKKDFSDHTTTWVEPISAPYRGYTVYELPPNGQGLTALQMLNILEGFDIASLGHNSPEYLHCLIEAKKLAFGDRDYHITDPEAENVPVDVLISKDYAETCRKQIDLKQAMNPPSPSALINSSETVYVTAIDSDRNAVSFISSIFKHFGSGVVVDGTGIILQNRGKSFSLDPDHPNRMAPHKRPMHTIIPGMVFKDDKLMMSFGVMGGDMQPQGHTQFLANLIDFKLNLQEAIDAPRVRHMQGKEVFVEDGIPDETKSMLEDKGHRVIRDKPATNQVGGGQAIFLDRNQNVLYGASDRRKDGCAIGY
ncbi:gamma-glutamyltransferase [Thermodesulfobacteriota bacterium]